MTEGIIILFCSGIDGCQAMITNLSSIQYEVDVLWQIPAGSIPISHQHCTRTDPRSLWPWGSEESKHWFYFPEEGKYTHFPVHVSVNEVVVASGGVCFPKQNLP